MNIIEGHNELETMSKKFNDISNLIDNEIKEDKENDILSLKIIKRSLDKENKFRICAEYKIEDKELKI